MIPRARHLVAAALSSALLMAPAFTGIANAARDSRVFAVSLAKTAVDVKRVADYWTPDQLKQADSYSPATPGTQAATPAPSASAQASNAATQAATTVTRAVAAQAVPPVLPRK